ncbi:regulator of G protein signaling domain-containing protein [Gongronella butleri]|nr:regulator of G protein signaling domain-containing protein [Gongronella butleri]
MSQAYTSVMKFTVDGRPYIKDVHDLFGALVTQVKFDSHRYLFRNYDNTITSDDALNVLSNLQFTRSMKVPDPEDNFRLVTTITTTTFNMERSVAKALCQQFLSSRLMVNAVDPSNRTFRDRGLWQITPKGLIVLNEFCKNTGKEHYLLRQFPVDGLALVPLERYDDDQLCLNRQNMASLFRTMMDGLQSVSSSSSSSSSSNSQKEDNQANDAYPPSVSTTTTRRSGTDRHSAKRNSVVSTHSTASSTHSSSYNFTAPFSVASLMSAASSLASSAAGTMATTEKFHLLDNRLLQTASSMRGASASTSTVHMSPNANANGTPSMGQSRSDTTANSSNGGKKVRKIFSSQLCCDWLVAFCTLASREEAELVASEFLRHGWIELQNKDDAKAITASKGTLLLVTTKGRNMILTDPGNNKPLAATNTKSAGALVQQQPSSPQTSSTASNGANLAGTGANGGIGGIGVTSQVGVVKPRDATMMRSYTTRPSSAAMDHSPTVMYNRQQQQEGNSARLMIVLNDPQLRSLFKDFLKQNFCAENLDFWIDYTNLRRKCKTQNPAMMSQSQKDLLEDAYVIWSNYLSPGAKWELNVDHDLQQELARLVNSMIKFVPGDYAPTMVNMSSQSNSQCLRTILKRFDRVEEQICRLMASDSVPKFVTWLTSYQKKEKIPGLDQGITLLKA